MKIVKGEAMSEVGEERRSVFKIPPKIRRDAREEPRIPFEFRKLREEKELRRRVIERKQRFS